MQSVSTSSRFSIAYRTFRQSKMSDYEILNGPAILVKVKFLGLDDRSLQRRSGAGCSRRSPGGPSRFAGGCRSVALRNQVLWVPGQFNRWGSVELLVPGAGQARETSGREFSLK